MAGLCAPRPTRKKEKFTALLHHISAEHLEAAFFELKENAAPGVDGLTWAAYEAALASSRCKSDVMTE